MPYKTLKESPIVAQYEPWSVLAENRLGQVLERMQRYDTKHAAKHKQ